MMSAAMGMQGADVAPTMRQVAACEAARAQFQEVMAAVERPDEEGIGERMVGRHDFQSFPSCKILGEPEETTPGAPLLRRWVSDRGNGLIVVGLPESMGVGPAEEGVGWKLLAGLEAEDLSVLGTVPGPFSLAFVDRDRERVLLARDRLGRRRLFFKVDSEGLQWSPDLLSLSRTSRPVGLDQGGLQEILAFRWSQGSKTALANIEQVQPGGAVWIDRQGEVQRSHFWTLPVDPQPAADSFETWVDRAGDAVGQGVDCVLAGAQRPFVLLSGGVDSSLLAAVAAEAIDDLVAVTPTWKDQPNPELPRARRYAEHLGLEHRILTFTEREIARLTPRVIELFGGPIRDYHMVVLAGVYEALSEEGFDLVLHGQAADTVFGSGNLRFAANFQEKRRKLRYVPDRVLRMIGRAVPPSTPFLDRLGFLLSTDTITAARRIQRLLHRPSVRRQRPALLQERDPRPELLARADWGQPFPAPLQIVDFYQGTVSHMVTSTAISDPFGITMGYPYLTPEVLEVALALPDEYKERDGVSKPVMKALGSRFYPREWVLEEKLGFPTPTVFWMRGELAPWIEKGLGEGSWSRTNLGEALIEDLALPADFELMWTLAGLEEFLGLAFPGRLRSEIPAIPG